MPPLPDETTNIVLAFEQLGRVETGGFSLAPLRYAEITACAPWATERERNLIRDMSREYLVGRHLGEDPFGIPPWQG